MSHSPTDPQRSGRVAIVGRPNVGKSTLFNALLGEPIAITSPHPHTTREPVHGVLTVGNAQYVFLDTPGFPAMRTGLGQWLDATARQAANSADLAALVVEPRVNPADLTLARELEALPTVLVLNKIDKHKDKEALLPVMAAFAAAHSFVATVPVSAQRSDGIDRLLKEFHDLLPLQPFLYQPDTLSDQPVRHFVAEFVREQILAHTRHEVPHGVAVQVERFDESTPVPFIEIAVHVAREAHKKILIGARGQMMKRIGTAARVRVEQMLGKQVHLKLWVRTTPDWMNDPTKLRELGYGDAADSGKRFE